jgi:hypothetical protein
MKALYCGIFKYSPTNANPKLTLFKGKVSHGMLVERELEITLKRLESFKGSELCNPHNMYEIWRLKTLCFNMQVADEENVFYIMDKEYNILYETHDIWDEGNLSKTVENAMKEYGIDRSFWKTSDSLFELKHSIFVSESLTRFAEEMKQGKHPKASKYFNI